MRFHVLGIGSIGSLVASHLRRVLPTSDEITLIARRRTVAQPSERAPSSIIVEHKGIRSEVSGFQSELSDAVQENTYDLLRSLSRQETTQVTENEETKAPTFYRAIPNPEIQAIIVATKATDTFQALRACRHRLTPNTTIVLLQNGMGIYERVVEGLFPNPESRPNFIIASTTHGAWKHPDIPNQVNHAGFGELLFGIVPDSRTNGKDFERSFWDHPQDTPEHQRSLDISDLNTPAVSRSLLMDNTKYLSLQATVAALLSLDLNVQWLPMAKLQIRLRQKLAVNSSVNPITALMGCRNGDLFANKHATDLIRRVCFEASRVYRASYETSSAEGDWLFSGGKSASGGMHVLSGPSLQQETMNVLRKTSANYSSMFQDIEKGKPLEIEFMNGYLSQLAATYNLRTPTVDALRSAVLLKASLRNLV